TEILIRYIVTPISPPVSGANMPVVIPAAGRTMPTERRVVGRRWCAPVADDWSGSMRESRFKLWLAGVLTLTLLAADDVVAFSFVTEHIYSTNGPLNIVQYEADGAVIDTITLSSELGTDLKGLAFGPDELLYVVAIRPTGFAVLAIDDSGTVQTEYPSTYLIHGNLSYGKIAVDDDNIYV